MRIGLVLVALVAAIVIGLLVYGSIDKRTRPSEDVELVVDSGSDDDGAKASNATRAREGDDADAEATNETRVDEPLVPRVLPPDAALEDVRDALASKSADAVRAAYERITRMSRKSASFGASITKLAKRESDRALARIVERAAVTPWSELDPNEQEALLAGVR
ncbi:MAG: hypothetical protein QNJ98_14720 [Planctomycetota bacterium]|nr:hypothetical protein [Planctomycetota bacterium]